MKTIKQTYLINAPKDKVWQALVDPKIINEWGGGPSKMDDKVGTNFKFWGGDIYGTNTIAIKEKELVQDWYGGKWDKPSKVTFRLRARGGKTEIELIHENLPEGEEDNFASGWKDYFLGPMKEYLEKSN